MRFEEIDEETRVFESEAMAELKRHDIGARFFIANETRSIVAEYSRHDMETVCTPDENGKYSALEILEFLGY